MHGMRNVFRGCAASALLLISATLGGEEELPYRDAVVPAPAIDGITIDGKLDDWPPAMPRHAIFNLLPDGAKSWDGPDFSTSPDLSCAFMVGYDLQKQLLYVAVIVQDDSLIIGHMSDLVTDGMELMVDGLRSDRAIPPPPGWWKQADLRGLPVQHYIAIPGKGDVYGIGKNSSPVVLGADLNQLKTNMKFTREGDVTIYEWAVQVFDQFPDEPTKLKPGKRIGFDLVVVDKDVPARHPLGRNEPPEDVRAWVYWGPTWNGEKTLNAGSLGEVILGE